MKQRRILFILILLAGGTLAGVFFLRSQSASESVGPYVVIEGVEEQVRVTVVDTPQTREQGLSGRSTLAPNEGMLFIFDSPEKLSFWMKDMLFSIDIIWIGSDWTVVDTTEHLTPESYPTTVSPRSPAQYVLEVPAGFIQAHDVEIGRSVTFEK